MRIKNLLPNKNEGAKRTTKITDETNERGKSGNLNRNQSSSYVNIIMHCSYSYFSSLIFSAALAGFPVNGLFANRYLIYII